MKVMLTDGAYMPTRAHPSDAGLDIYSKEMKLVPAGGSAVFHTGVHVELPSGTCGVLMSKSGLLTNHSIYSTGLIDEGYTGEIVVKLQNHSDRHYLVSKGDKISQLVILPCFSPRIEVVQSLPETERGEKGFGSSGK